MDYNDCQHAFRCHDYTVANGETNSSRCSIPSNGLDAKHLDRLNEQGGNRRGGQIDFENLLTSM